MADVAFNQQKSTFSKKAHEVSVFPKRQPKFTVIHTLFTSLARA